MIIYPAVDLSGGRVVRLREGDRNQEIVFSDHPGDVARRWLDEGAGWLHVVNLDGAFGESNQNLRVLEQIAALPVKVQFGGGLRDLKAIRRAVDAGAGRVVLGTVAAQNPEIVREAVEAHGSEAVCVALDARDGVVVTHGWQQPSAMTPAELGGLLATFGVQYALFTDVSRDGMLDGVNVNATEALAVDTGLKVIASGGVATLTDVRRLADGRIVAGAVIGMALYTGAFTLSQALEAAAG
ncbi:MAG: 1-(5-phosphoribosyl)-5-[(5-phosphoribosylamino)methylideneamino]imidazole-4-carboxamide isomerase [Anaerolineae bacterium]|nr:1-(5-phosphoribosyl)-5-[(5-phosphoribosylamino)methylideneamino]imidazole-4-carboxamide isomerase [Anaerolineae bacterium]NUQ02785.1 1-(5-phosphoribosyl)-5-[(5-phosphoribosylamino)methylideneamino]imidazole-4-carboxamide isomerase [Anaerolineae bacterium]